MMLSSGIVFPFALTFLVAGVYLNEEVHGWGLRSIDLLGNMCIGLGFLLLIVSMAGLASWKFGSRLFLFPYFILMLVIMSLMGLTAIYAYVENGRLHHFLRVHWSDIQVRLGVSLSYEGVNGTGNTQLTYEDAVNMLHRSFEIVGGIGLTIVLVLLLGFCGAVWELGVRNISIALMISMDLLAILEGILAWFTRGGVPIATTYLFAGAAVAQFFSSCTGVLGFCWLNCEFLFWSLVVLLISALALSWVTVATYFWLVDTRVDAPENLLIVFTTALVSSIIMFTTILFMLFWYCKRRAAFLAADKKYEIHGEMSDYKSRLKDRRKSAKNGKKLPVAEIGMGSLAEGEEAGDVEAPPPDKEKPSKKSSKGGGGGGGSRGGGRI